MGSESNLDRLLYLVGREIDLTKVLKNGGGVYSHVAKNFDLQLKKAGVRFPVVTLSY